MAMISRLRCNRSGERTHPRVLFAAPRREGHGRVPWGSAIVAEKEEAELLRQMRSQAGALECGGKDTLYVRVIPVATAMI